MNVSQDYMIVSDEVKAQIADLVLQAELNLPLEGAGTFGPVCLAHSDLGHVEVPRPLDQPPTSKPVAYRVFARHAVDPVIFDGHGNLVLIIRSKAPAAGKYALPGGMIDTVGQNADRAEWPRDAAIREAGEETSIDVKILKRARCVLGQRIYVRTHDIRQAWRDLAGTPIKKGDLFIVTTQPIYFHVDVDLSQTSLSAGDDAAGLILVKRYDLSSDDMGSLDHFQMISGIDAILKDETHETAKLAEV